MTTFPPSSATPAHLYNAAAIEQGARVQHLRDHTSQMTRMVTMTTSPNTSSPLPGGELGLLHCLRHLCRAASRTQTLWISTSCHQHSFDPPYSLHRIYYGLSKEAMPERVALGRMR